MPQPYPNPSINESRHLFEYANTVTGGWFVMASLVASTVVMFLILKSRGNRTSDSFSVTLVLNLVFATLFWGLEMITGRIVVIFLALTIASILWSTFDSSY